MTALSGPEARFFHEHAGYSWDPKIETAEEGHIRCAEQLANAELWAKRHSVTFEWEQDEDCWGDDKFQMCVTAIYPGGEYVSLGGIECDPELGGPDDDNKRVCEAEMALALASDMGY